VWHDLVRPFLSARHFFPTLIIGSTGSLSRSVHTIDSD
jgi:hypothetical protein